MLKANNIKALTFNQKYEVFLNTLFLKPALNAALAAAPSATVAAQAAAPAAAPAELATAPAPALADLATAPAAAPATLADAPAALAVTTANTTLTTTSPIILQVRKSARLTNKSITNKSITNKNKVKWPKL